VDSKTALALLVLNALFMRSLGVVRKNNSALRISAMRAIGSDVKSTLRVRRIAEVTSAGPRRNNVKHLWATRWFYSERIYCGAQGGCFCYWGQMATKYGLTGTQSGTQFVARVVRRRTSRGTTVEKDATFEDRPSAEQWEASALAAYGPKTGST
jgi:hypothetical protein